MERGYNENIVGKAIEKNRNLSRQELLAIPSRSKIKQGRGEESATGQGDPRLILTYNKQKESLSRIITNNWHLLGSDPVLGSKLSSRPTITYRKAPSTSDFLVSSSPEVTKKSGWLSSGKGFVKCSTCKACKHGISKTMYRTAFNTTPTKIDKLITCKTEIAIYILECSCGLQYVGSTKLQVHKRILQHLRAITNSDTTYPVARHFNEKHGNDISHLKYYAIDAIPPLSRGGNREALLRKLETRYILEFDCKSPHGLNTTEDLYTWL